MITLKKIELNNLLTEIGKIENLKIFEENVSI